MVRCPYYKARYKSYAVALSNIELYWFLAWGGGVAGTKEFTMVTMVGKPPGPPGCYSGGE